MKKTLTSLFLSLTILIITTCFVFAAEQAREVAPGLTWYDGTVVNGNLSKTCYSKLSGYDYWKWVKAELSGNVQEKEADADIANVEARVYGNFWDTGYTNYDYE